MTELDKFKRRMIRAVARLLQEKKAEDELWDQMKKETGCDCRLLWERMRALTLKKLRRLLLSDDKSENVASIARMSLTDWLLFDLVLVHEKIDFIERDILESNKEMKPLIELFYLVQKFQIESLRSNALADAWTAATVIYNSKGHQCSPMLLQRRWYQLKEATRERFYTFWFKYRGNAKALTGAGEFMPSRLQAAIAKRYNDVITKPFLDWDKMIDERLVILPDEFESKMRNINFKMPVDSNNDPELILVEPIIETIDLGADSDSDQQEQIPSTDSNTSKKEMPPLIRIKREPKDTTINDDDNSSCDAEMLRAMNKQLPQKVLDATSIEEQALLESENETLNALVNKSITTGTGGIVVDAESDDVAEASEVTNANDVIMPQISNVFGNVTSESLSLLTDQTVHEVVSETSNNNIEIELKMECLNTLEDSYTVENYMNNESEDSTLQKTLPEAEQIVSNDTDENNLVQLIINSSDEDIGIRDGHSNNVINETEVTNINHDTNVESENANVSIGHGLENEVEGTVQNAGSLLPPDAPSNVKVEMEDVINLDDDNSAPQINNFTENIVTSEHAEDAGENSDNIEDDIICIRSEDIVSKPTEIQDPVVKVENFPVDANFSNDGIEFVDDGIEFIDEDDDSNSKTNDENIMKHLPIKCEADEETPKFDLKLLLNPIVYTKKLDDLSVFTDNVFEVKSKDLIDYIEKECKPLCVMSNDVTNIKQEIQDAIATSANDDLLNNDSSDESDFEDIPESYKVKISSYLLQKPKSRTYNPIQLCKNPDFNTRLKRLPVGFFSSTRNCRLLKSCKPMTIDVNKTFENKLINGTIYLKSNNINDYVVNDAEEEKVPESNQTVSVLPSAMAAQSLIDNNIALPASKQVNIQTDYIRPILANKYNDNTLISERSRVINLPDISQIRRINQKLLTAEVTPIRVQHTNDPSNTTVQLVANIDCDVETNASGGQPTQPNISEVINVPNKPASVVIEVDKKPVIIPDQKQMNIPSKTSNASKIEDFIKQIEATGSEIAKADPKPDIISCQVNDKMSKEKNPKPKNPPNKYSKRIYPEVSWLSAKRHPIIKNDDSLLTLDTLNKMLNIINGDVIVDKDGQFQINKKKEKKASQLSQSKESKIEGPPSKSKKTEKALSKSKDQHIIEKMRKTKKPKIKIIPGSNRKDDLPQKKQVCCHKLSLENQAKENAACVVLSDDDDDTALHNACESIERVVRQTHEVDPKTASVTVVQAKNHEVDPNTASVSVVQAKKMFNAEVQTTPVEVMRTPTIEIEVRSSPAEGVEPLDIQTEKGLTPLITNIKITRLIGSDGASEKTTVAPALCGSTMIANDNLDAVAIPLSKQKKLVKHTVNIQNSVTNSKSDCSIPNQSMQVDSSKVKRKYSYRTAKRVLPKSYYQTIPDEDDGRQRRDKKLLYQAMPCSCRLPSVSLDTPKRHIIIDGSTSCALHNQTNTNIKHKLLLMNSKNISREPTERPISLGKNKILLTTVKLPKHTQPPPDLFQNPQVIPSLPLPSGVQLILLPTGELTYFVEPNVQLNDEQMSSIPIIMAAVKRQLDTCSVPPTPAANVVMNNDIVNISDDESATSVNTFNDPQTNSNNVDVESYIEKHTINEMFINKLNKSNDSKHDLIEDSKKETNDVNNLKEHTNKEEKNTDVTLNLNINKEVNDGDHMNENINKMTVGVDGPNINVSIETKNTNDNLNENVNTPSNVENNILNKNDYKEKNVVGDLIENVNVVKKNVGDQIENITGEKDVEDDSNVNEEKKVVDQTENITTENNAVDDSNDNVNKEKMNIHDSIENMDTETNVEGDLKKNLNEEKINFRNDDVDKEHKDSESATNSTAARKTILSDLMEMSGISAEDTVSMLQQNVTSENIEGTITDNGTILNMHNVVPPLAPLSNIIHETDVDAANIPELTPITSLSELKYACEQEDGQFFKLDLDTGVLIPINVCIKKHTKHSSPLDTSSLLKPIAPKEVMIDLTDDNDILVEENKSSKPMMYNNLLSRNNYKSLLKSARGDNSVKPIKIFKSVHANILRKQFRNNLTESKVCVELDKKKSRKRKQRLSQIEAKIDLVDSDAPMEEEYLMDSCDDSLDSSDDEPLAAIAKRKRAENTVTNMIKGDKVDSKSNESNVSVKDTSDKSEVHMDTADVPLNSREGGNNYGHTDVTQAPSAATEVPSPVTYAPDVTEPSPDVVSEIESSQVPCDDDVNEPPQISFLSDDNYDSDESEENCILGV